MTDQEDKCKVVGENVWCILFILLSSDELLTLRVVFQIIIGEEVTNGTKAWLDFEE